MPDVWSTRLGRTTICTRPALKIAWNKTFRIPTQLTKVWSYVGGRLVSDANQDDICSDVARIYNTWFDAKELLLDSSIMNLIDNNKHTEGSLSCYIVGIHLRPSRGVLCLISSIFAQLSCRLWWVHRMLDAQGRPYQSLRRLSGWMQKSCKDRSKESVSETQRCPRIDSQRLWWKF